MSKRRASRKDRCPRCHIHYRLCFCQLIKPIETKSRLSLILHASELNLTSNTGRLACDLLTHSEILVRGAIENKEEILTLTTPPQYTAYYLFPEEGAQELNEEFVSTLKTPIHLIVPDGSWRQAKKFKRREPALENLPCLTLPAGPSSSYFLRTEPMDNFVCTLEAIARALGILEGQHVQDHLESVLKVMVERTLMARSGKHHL